MKKIFCFSKIIIISFLLSPPHFSCGLTRTDKKRSEKEEEKIHGGNDLMGGLRWNNLSVSLPKKKYTFLSRLMRRKRESDNARFLLQPSSGFVPNGHICAIIGPSGAGKSTLLSALSGTTPKGSGKIIKGSVWIDLLQSDENNNSDGNATSDEDGYIDHNMRISKSFLSMKSGQIALLSQSDTFFSMLTPRETLHLATFLQLVGIDKVEREMLIDRTLDQLGLRHVESRRIGNPIIGPSGNIRSGSLSGGERRRLSVALELVSNPMVFLADEPTTGLDSSQAQKVFNVIAKTVRGRNIPCICSIHQPRASIWKELDSFILLAPGGKMVYMGKRTEAVSYFASLGYKCPPETTTAEFFIDLVTIDTEDEDMALIDTERINYLADAFQERQKNVLDAGSKEAFIPPKGRSSKKNMTLLQKNSYRPFLSRLGVLLLRSLRQNFRDVKVNMLRGAASIGLARLFSELFSGVKSGKSLAKSVADRTALLSYGVINMCMLAAMKTLNLFGRERAVVAREQMRRQYSSFEYLLSKSIGELPLDVFYSTIFAAALKCFTCIRISLPQLCATFSLMTVAASSIGFAVGSVTSGVEEAMTAGMPIMIIFMAVGIINPGGVDTSIKNPFVIQLLKRISPIGMAIEALCIAEYKGMDFGEDGTRWSLKDLPRMGGLALVRNGDQVIDALGLTNKSYEDVMHSMAVVCAMNLLLSWFGLSHCGTKFTTAIDVSNSQGE